MRKMKRKIIFLPVLVAIAGQSAFAQNNQTVVVTNKFDFDTSGHEKIRREMSQPDSLTVFEKSFDYSVFDKAYAGAYDFNPYGMNLQPVSEYSERSRFWLNAGIGYTLKPEFDLVYEPFRGPKASFGVYARHRSFSGEYRQVGLDEKSFLRQLRDENGKRLYYGPWNYDMDNEAGLDFAYDWDKVGLSANIAYDGLLQKDFFMQRSQNVAKANVRLFSKDSFPKIFSYSVFLDYSLGKERISARTAASELLEHRFDFGFGVGADFRDKGHFALDAYANTSTYGYDLQHFAMIMDFTPHYVWTIKGWTLDLGLRFDIPVRSSNAGNLNKAGSQYAYPAIGVSYEFSRIPMNLHLSVTGGESLGTYTGIVSDFRHYSLNSSSIGNAAGISSPVLGNEVERVKAELGVSGRIRSVFSYDVAVSYSEKASVVTEAVNFVRFPFGEGTNSAELMPYYTLVWLGAGQFNASVKAEYADDWGSVRLGLLYTDFYLRGSEPVSYIAPASLVGNFDMKFNILRRIYLGVGCDFSTARSMNCLTASAPDGYLSCRLPGWGDPYLNAGYVINPMVSVWLKANRFTGQTIYSAPLYSERGPHVIAGLSLSF